MFKSRKLYTILITRRHISSQETDVIFETINNAGIIALNRSKFLNTLNTTMTKDITSYLSKWEKMKDLVIIKSNGGKAFSAGGDLKVLTNKNEAPEFLQNLFYLFYVIGNCQIPYIAFIDGIAMGSGLLLSAFGKYRVATERTVIGMPETKVGMFLTYSGLFKVPGFSKTLALYLTLTSETLNGRDVYKSGFATHFVSTKKLSELENALSKCRNDGEVKSILDRFNETPGDISLLNVKDIDYCFSVSNIEDIIARLKTVNNEWSDKTLEKIYKMCPGSLKISLRLLQRVRQLEHSECLKMEHRLFVNAIENHDFREGARAFFIDKDNRPQWNPRTLADVNDEYIESVFKMLPDDKELNLNPVNL